MSNLTSSEKCHSLPLISYAVHSEFDIDHGSTVRKQYPTAVPWVSADWLAEHMIPEGAHLREMDVTYMILNRKGDDFVRTKAANDARFRGSSLSSPSLELGTSAPTAESVDSAHSSVTLNSNGSVIDSHTASLHSYVHYGINIVMNKNDASVRRGAVVKSIALFSVYPWVESLKWALFAAVEELFANPSDDLLNIVCSALNSVSTASIPCATLLGQQMMLRTSVDVNVYGQLVAREQQRQRFIGEHSQALPNAAKDDVHEPTVMPKVLHDWHHVTSCVMFGKPSKLSIPLYISSDQIGDINISRLVSVFRQDVMRIFTGILAGQRILFVGYGHAARDIAQMVMSAVAMISPALIGVTRRAYPYVTLSDLSFLDTRGYIAGCTNPMFTQKKSWCDLLCILDLPHNKGTVVENTPLKNLTVDELADMHGQQQTATSPRLARSIESAPDAGEGWISGLSDSPGASISDKHSRSANDDAMYVAAGEGRDSVYFAHTLVEVSLTAHAVHDKEWITALLSEIEVERASEELVRRRFQDLTLQLVLHAQDAPGTSASPRWSDTAKKAAQIHAYRTELLRAATEFQDAMKFSTSPFLDAARYWASSSVGSASSADVGAVPVSATESEKETLKGSSDTNISAITNSLAQSSHIPLSRGQAVICRNHVRRLATYATLHWSETEVIFKDLDKALSTEYAFCALLVCFPAEQGVHLIGTGLLSCSPTVRKCAVRILQRLRSYPSASAAFSFLNGILKKAYSRVTAKDRNGVLESELNNWNAASQAALADAMRHQRQPSDSSLVLADAY